MNAKLLSNAGFLILSTSHISDQIILCGGIREHPVGTIPWLLPTRGQQHPPTVIHLKLPTPQGWGGWDQ